MNNYRHVCFKDLENYFKKSDYFGDLNEDEKKIIRQNLDIPSIDDIGEKTKGVIELTYEDLKELVDSNDLNLFSTYLLTDFQTIYESNVQNEVWGLTKEPSQTYLIVLNPISKNLFSQNVEILINNVAVNWIVKYDFTQEQLCDGTKTKGKIIYLQDENNNRAYYDFKNIKFQMWLNNSDVSGLKNSGNYNLYTFSSIVNGKVIENSKEAFNNHFDQDCYENVFLGQTENNHFFGGFKLNIFTDKCKYNRFEWNTFGNKFNTSIIYTQGSVQNALIRTIAFDSAISKEFKMLYSESDAKPIFVVTKLDAETLTTQVTIINLEKR